MFRFLKKILPISLFFILFGCLLLTPVKPLRLVWAEHFDQLDPRIWNHLVTAWRGGNEEFEYYRDNRRNSYVENGMLHIRPTLVAEELGEQFLYTGNLTENGCTLSPCSSVANGYEITTPIFSARIRTLPTFSFRYGRMDVRAKMPRGDWIWPAIWMLPENNNVYGGWPIGGEIDIAELRCNRDYRNPRGVNQGIQRYGATLHFGPKRGYDGWRHAHWELELENGDFSDDFHVYGLEWSNSSIAFYLDGRQVGRLTPPRGGFWELGGFDQNPGGPNVWREGIRMAPFDERFYILLNVAVGGKFFPDGFKNYPYERPWNLKSGQPMREFWEARNLWQKTWDRPEMIVDYILVYQ